jgi:hypothetical protein
MHRPSAADNPPAPLSHHQLDSTHISHGVIRAGVDSQGFGLDASVFHGREPDEDRIGLDMGTLDSYAVRGRWRRGVWSAQVSAAHLHQPEILEPFDVTRLTASVAFTGSHPGRPVAAMLAWGRNRERFGDFDGYLVEACWTASKALTLFGRGELVDKSILGVGAHPPGFVHPHPRSRVGAFTLGLSRELRTAEWGSVAIGGDVTLYRVPDNLEFFYGSPFSSHVFLRYRAPRPSSMAHLH